MHCEAQQIMPEARPGGRDPDPWAERLLDLAPALAANAHQPVAMREFGARLSQMIRWLRTEPRRLAEATDQEVIAFLLDHAQTFDYHLVTSARSQLEPLVAGVVTLHAGFAEVADRLIDCLEAERLMAFEIVERRGLKRISIRVGGPFVPGRIQRSSAPAVPTAEPEWDGRVAGVVPGDGGWSLNGEVVVPAKATAYRCSTHHDSVSGAASRPG